MFILYKLGYFIKLILIRRGGGVLCLFVCNLKNWNVLNLKMQDDVRDWLIIIITFSPIPYFWQGPIYTVCHIGPLNVYTLAPTPPPFSLPHIHMYRLYVIISYQYLFRGKMIKHKCIVIWNEPCTYVHCACLKIDMEIPF